MTSTIENLKAAFAGESQANRKYLAYAARALDEGFPEVARLFCAAAAAETIHAIGHFRNMEAVGATRANLEDAVSGETYEFEQMYPPMLELARSETHRAKTMFEFALKAEQVHAALYTRALDAVRANRDLEGKGFYLCPFCGHIEFGKPGAKCPICGAAPERYRAVAHAASYLDGVRTVKGATITLKGNAIHTIGELPAVGTKAPDFTLTGGDLADVTLASFAGKKKLLNIVPSLDTGVCAASARKFNVEAAKVRDAVILAISRDLPFAQKRFCEAEGITVVVPLSELRSADFGLSYGTRIVDGPLAGLNARAIVVIDRDDTVVHTELVPEIAQEPNYEKALTALANA